MLNNPPAHWDLEVDVVAIGSGIGGLSAAITAHDHGGSALVLERASQLGGVTALSMGEVWVAGNHLAAALGIEDSVDNGFNYLRTLSMGYGDERAMLNFVVHSPVALRYFEEKIGLRMAVIEDCPDYYYRHNAHAVAAGRMLEVLPFPGESLGEWQSHTRVSPQVPFGMTHADMSAGGGTANMLRWDYAVMGDRLAKDERCLGPGLAAAFVKGALDRGIAIHSSTSAEELIGDGERIIGVRAVRDGKDIFIRANKGVVVAVSSYERNPDLNKTLSQQLDIGSMVFSTVDGANFRLACPAGARIARVPDITSMCFHVPGEEDDEGQPLWRPTLPFIGQPHVIVVNAAGRRFGNEAFYRDFYYQVDRIDGSAQAHPNFPCWALLDSQAREKYPFGSVMPGQDWPDGLGVVADTLEELAQKTGIDAAALSTTVADFNTHAARGEDPVFGRGTHPWSVWMCGDPYHEPNANLGTLAKPPFYAVQLRRMGGSAIPAAGLLADQHCRAVGWDEKPIEGLYVAGNSMARMETGAVMQSGISNARGMTHGYLAARHALGQPSELLDAEARRLAG
ncbi:FAD-binding protein [Mangrovimicrobium sediminis]|uniref:FAD-binding protein n=1 Tax=Mangrovimicrobium sediminis TaxID=2562682 RepID=A0A4Z0LUV1_9GAMM|nr:FAD-binding protein [Haliea sp. SAOS-164]TGD71059.1 FAD-binding protein [Haliea sp. SAOS-164]